MTAGAVLTLVILVMRIGLEVPVDDLPLVISSMSITSALLWLSSADMGTRGFAEKISSI